MKLLKPYFALLALPVIICSCHTSKPVAAKTSQKQNSSVFIEDISVNPSGSATTKKTESPMPDLKDTYTYQIDINHITNIEHSLPKQFKYAILLNVDVEALDNADLLNYIDNWWGVPYRYGGNSQDGIDCSAFTQGLLSSVYNISIPRIAREQKKNAVSVRDSRLKQGDLVFFNTRGGVSHVGIYLCNNKFVHASTSSGVTISDLNDSYWEKRYIGAGRPKEEAVVANK